MELNIEFIFLDPYSRSSEYFAPSTSSLFRNSSDGTSKTQFSRYLVRPTTS